MKWTIRGWIACTTMAIAAPLTGCAAGNANRAPTNAPRSVPQSQTSTWVRQDLANVVKASYEPNTATVVLDTIAVDARRRGATTTAVVSGAQQPQTTGSNATSGYGRSVEPTIDVAQPLGVINYATSQFATQRIRWVEIRSNDGGMGHVPRLTQRIAVPRAMGQATAVSRDQNAINLESGAASFAGGMGQVPPGVTIDAGISQRTSLGASNAAKFDALLQVARSKLGTPYIWGHNEDRGQFGFDCSNFTAYVYHHALGYVISPLSRTQYTSVGWNVPTYQIQPGDLLVFEYGKHVGIAVGNGRMIECGGGLGRVGYLSIQSGTYWGNHLTAVKRMY